MQCCWQCSLHCYKGWFCVMILAQSTHWKRCTRWMLTCRMDNETMLGTPDEELLEQCRRVLAAERQNGAQQLARAAAAPESAAAAAQLRAATQAGAAAAPASSLPGRQPKRSQAAAAAPASRGKATQSSPLRAAAAVRSDAELVIQFTLPPRHDDATQLVELSEETRRRRAALQVRQGGASGAARLEESRKRDSPEGAGPSGAGQPAADMQPPEPAAAPQRPPAPKRPKISM